MAWLYKPSYLKSALAGLYAMTFAVTLVFSSLIVLMYIPSIRGYNVEDRQTLFGVGRLISSVAIVAYSSTPFWCRSWRRLVRYHLS